MVIPVYSVGTFGDPLHIRPLKTAAGRGSTGRVLRRQDRSLTVGPRLTQGRPAFAPVPRDRGHLVHGGHLLRPHPTLERTRDDQGLRQRLLRMVVHPPARAQDLRPDPHFGGAEQVQPPNFATSLSHLCPQEGGQR